MPWPSLMCWSALTLSGVRCKLHKQSRWTFFKSQSEIHDGIGLAFQKSNLKAPCGFSEVQPLTFTEVKHWTCQLLSLAVTYSLMSWSAKTLSAWRVALDLVQSQSEVHDGIGWPSRSPTWKHRVLFEVQPWHSQSSKWTNVFLSIDVLWCPDRQRNSETITLDLLQSQSGIAAESYQRNQAQQKILRRSSMKATCGFFEMPWPTLMSWSALTLSGVRCELHKQSRLTFFKSQSENPWRNRAVFQKSNLKAPCVFFRGSPLTVTEVNILTCQLLPSTLTFSDVLIGIDLVRGKMWPSETITFFTFFKVNRESDGIRRNVPTKSGVSLDNSVRLFRDALTFADVN